LLIVGVERWSQQDEGGDATGGDATGGDATGGVGDLADFVFGQGTAQQVGLAVAEPFLDNLVAADGVLPDVGPEDDVVQVDVVDVVAEGRAGLVRSRAMSYLAW